MKVFSTILFFWVPTAMVAFMLVMMSLGKRLGQAMEMRSFYFLYLLGAVIFLLSAVAELGLFLVTQGNGVNEVTLYKIKAFLIFLPQSIGVYLAAYATVKYWRWIWDELGEKEQKKS